MWVLVLLTCPAKAGSVIYQGKEYTPSLGASCNKSLFLTQPELDCTNVALLPPASEVSCLPHLVTPMSQNVASWLLRYVKKELRTHTHS